MKLVLIVGPSGSGKDTLLRSARAALGHRQDIQFARRYITRPPDSNEDNYYVDPQGFNHLSNTGYFLSTWRAHNNCYGIPIHILTDSNRLSTIICSISRSAIVDFEKYHENTTTILITAPEQILHARLQGRGRETDKDIQQRLVRASATVHANNLITFNNINSVVESTTRFTALLTKLCLDQSFAHTEPQLSHQSVK